MKSSTYKAEHLSKYFVPYKWCGNDWSGCDCYGLAELWYKNELQVNLPSYCRGVSGHKELDPGYIDKFKNIVFREVAVPETHDLVYMKDSMGLPRHIGIYIDGYVLHCVDPHGTLHQRCRDLDRRIISYHRYCHED